MWPQRNPEWGRRERGRQRGREGRLARFISFLWRWWGKVAFEGREEEKLLWLHVPSTVAVLLLLLLLDSPCVPAVVSKVRTRWRFDLLFFKHLQWYLLADLCIPIDVLQFTNAMIGTPGIRCATTSGQDESLKGSSSFSSNFQRSDDRRRRRRRPNRRFSSQGRKKNFLDEGVSRSLDQRACFPPTKSRSIKICGLSQREGGTILL